MLSAPGLKLIEWPKPAFEEYEESHGEITIEVLEDDARAIRLEMPD